MWRLLLQYYDAAASLGWTWQSADASLHKAPLGGEKNGPQPDRSREDGDEAPHPTRRRRRADWNGDHARQPPEQDRPGEAAGPPVLPPGAAPRPALRPQKGLGYAHRQQTGVA